MGARTIAPQGEGVKRRQESTVENASRAVAARVAPCSTLRMDTAAPSLRSARAPGFRLRGISGLVSRQQAGC